jgi:uncharacterized protein
MSAATAPIPSASLDEERRAHEPSMEEILASIRRIIADDDRLPPIRRDRSPELQRIDSAPESRPGGREPVFPAQAIYSRPALDPRVKWTRPEKKTDVEEPAAKEPDTAEPAASAPALDHSSENLIAVSARAPERAEDRIEGAIQGDESSFRAREQDAPPSKVADTLSDLNAPDFYNPESEATDQAATLVSSDAAASIGAHFQALAASTIINDSGILLDCAKEMLRPMLKQWLDANLPVMVEKLVRAEIERVARGRR